MKKFRSRLAIVLAMMVFLTSFTFLGAYAEDTDPQTDPGTEQAEPITAPAAPTVYAHSSYKSMVFLWVPDKDPNVKYLVNGQEYTPKTFVYKNTLKAVKSAGIKGSKNYGKTTTYYRYDVKGLKPGQKKSIKVVAYRVDENGNKLMSAAGTVKNNKGAVRTIGYKITIKTSGTLHSHGGPKRSMKVKKGQVIVADRFGDGGRYMFYSNHAKPSTFYIAKIRVKNVKAVYTKKFEYDAIDAELYVNAKKLKSKTGKLLWVNSYTQHLFYFTGPKNKAGKWKCVASWDCATGKASTPSPTGQTGIKKIERKVKSHHNIKWWLPYSDWNAVHGQRSGWKFGAPASHGCIRNPIKKITWLYKQIPIGTTLNIF